MQEEKIESQMVLFMCCNETFDVSIYDYEENQLNPIIDGVINENTCVAEGRR